MAFANVLKNLRPATYTHIQLRLEKKACLNISEIDILEVLY